MRTTLVHAVLWLTLAACSSSRSSNPSSSSSSPSPSATSAVDAGPSANAPTCAAKTPALDPITDTKCPVALPAKPDALDDALTAAGTDRCKLGYTAKDWSIYPASLRSDPFRLPWYDEVHDHSMRVPSLGRLVTKTLDDADASELPVTNALQVAAFGLGADVTPCVSAPTLDATQPLARAIASVIRDHGGTPDDAALEADAADVPLPLQEAVAEVVLAAAEAQAAWDAIASGLSANDLDALSKVHAIHLRSRKGPPKLTDTNVQSLLAKRFDMSALVRGAVMLSLHVERAKLARFAGTRGFELAQDTPLGRIVIRDAEDHEHAPGDHVLLLVDTGGNDKYTYAAGSADGLTNPKAHVGLAIDLQGRDQYGYLAKPTTSDGARLPADEGGRLKPSGTLDNDDGPVSLSETPRQGAARLGYGMLFDLGKDADKYRSLRLSQGYGAAGVGVLYDEGGDDEYDGEAGVQGSSHVGVGMLLDGGGDDTYRAYSQAQGFAGIRAVGVLHDREGNDRYLANQGDPTEGGDPLYWTIQRPGKGNNTFSQGAAWGRRSPGGADNVDMSGGLGVLYDTTGNDEYVASVQAQASGYWFGTGILADGAGNDSYDARYYVQGAGAHFAMSLFHEGGGDDRYNQTLKPTATSIGVGHDFTVAWHLDLGGNDVYRAPPLSLGSGNANGIGVLLNVGGDDKYETAAEPTLGSASFSQEWHNACEACHAVATTGIFMDVGGDDTYVSTSPVTRGNDVKWANRVSPAEYGVTEISAGVDAADGEISLP